MNVKKNEENSIEINNKDGLYSIDKAIVNFHFNEKLNFTTKYNDFVRFKDDFSLHYKKRKSTELYMIMDGDKLMGTAINYHSYGNNLFEITINNGYLYQTNNVFARLEKLIKLIEFEQQKTCTHFNFHALHLCYDSYKPFVEIANSIYNECDSNRESKIKNYSLVQKALKFEKFAHHTFYIKSKTLLEIAIYDKTIEMKEKKEKRYIAELFQLNGLSQNKNINRVEARLNNRVFNILSTKLGEIELSYLDDPNFRKFLFDKSIGNYLAFNDLTQPSIDKNRNKKYKRIHIYEADKHLAFPLKKPELSSFKNSILQTLENRQIDTERRFIKIQFLKYYYGKLNLTKLKQSLKRIAKLNSSYSFEANCYHVVNIITIDEDKISVKAYESKKGRILAAINDVVNPTKRAAVSKRKKVEYPSYIFASIDDFQLQLKIKRELTSIPYPKSTIDQLLKEYRLGDFVS